MPPAAEAPSTDRPTATMLQQIRDKISGWFAIVFLGAIAVVFIFWGIQFESTVTTGAAKVNGETLSLELVRRAWQERQAELQQQTRAELPEALVKAEQERLLEQFIQREVLAQRAHERGYRVTDQELAETLYSFPALQVDGQFSRDRYAALLRSRGETEARFEAELRRDLEVQQLRNGIAISAFVTPGELRRRAELEGEQREFDHVSIPAARFAAGITPAAADVAAFYEKNKSRFLSPETVSLQYLELRLADVAAGVEVTEEGLRRHYDQVAAERYTEPEQRHASHILVESGTDDAAAQKKAQALFARAKAGEDFAKLARENSDDPGSKAQGGDLGWATREAWVGPFAEAVFAMQPGEIRGPVKTQFGYHVIRLEATQPARQRGFDEVRAELEEAYRNEQAQTVFYERSQQLADDSFAALSELDSVARKLGLPLGRVDGFTRQGGGEFGADARVIDAAFSDEVLRDRQNSAPLTIGDDRVVVLRVVDHKEPAQRALADATPEIELVLREQAARTAAEQAAKAAAAKLAAGRPLAEVAAELGLQNAGPARVTRTDGTVPAELLKALFSSAVPVAGKSVAGTAALPNGDVAVFLLNSVTRGASGDSAALASRVPEAAAAAAATEFAAYVGELQRQAKISRNEQAFQ